MACDKYDKLTLLNFVTGNLSPKGGSEVTGHLQHCRECASFVNSVQEERSQFLRDFPESGHVAVIEKKNSSQRLFRRVFAIAATLVVVITGSAVLLRNQEPSFTTKGGVALHLFVLDRNGKPTTRESMTYFPGERVQFSYSCGIERYLILLSSDTAGAITRFYPVEGDSSQPVASGADIPLPHSIELDEYIGDELYIAVFSAHPLALPPVTEKVKAAVAAHEHLHAATLSIDGAVVKLIPLVKKRRSR
jgi:hypothetical protein